MADEAVGVNHSCPKLWQSRRCIAVGLPAGVNFEDGSPVCERRQAKVKFSVKAAWSTQGRVYGFRPVTTPQAAGLPNLQSFTKSEELRLGHAARKHGLTC